MADRVSKFVEDAHKLLESPINVPKVEKELKRLRTWLFKHQDESLQKGKQAELLSTVKSYYKVAMGESTESTLRDAVFGVVDDLLKLPEGKLVSSKTKGDCLKMLRQLGGQEETLDVDKSDESSSTVGVWLVADVMADSVTVVRGDEILENIPVLREEEGEGQGHGQARPLMDIITEHFDGDEGLDVRVKGDSEGAAVVIGLAHGT